MKRSKNRGNLPSNVSQTESLYDSLRSDSPDNRWYAYVDQISQTTGMSRLRTSKDLFLHERRMSNWKKACRIERVVNSHLGRKDMIIEDWTVYLDGDTCESSFMQTSWIPDIGALSFLKARTEPTLLRRGISSYLVSHIKMQYSDAHIWASNNRSDEGVIQWDSLHRSGVLSLTHDVKSIGSNPRFVPLSMPILPSKPPGTRWVDTEYLRDMEVRGKNGATLRQMRKEMGKSKGFSVNRLNRTVDGHFVFGDDPLPIVRGAQIIGGLDLVLRLDDMPGLLPVMLG